MRLRAWIAAAAFAAAALGCGSPAALLLPPPSPAGEALAWFPERSAAVAVLTTDRDDPGFARILGALESLAPGPMAQLPYLTQVGGLLGNDLVMGVVAPGDAPLAVLVTRDGDLLGMLAEARVKAGLAVPAGTYRGARLHAAGGHAFAVRQDVLLVSRSTGDLRRALDRRATEDGLAPRDVARPDGVHLRARVDARAAVLAADPRLRAVPWLAAARRLDVALRAERDAAALELELDTDAGALVPYDVPVTGGPGARMAEVRGSRLAVRDLGRVLAFVERAAERAAPLALLRAGPALPAARALARSLRAPATIIHRGGRWLLRAETNGARRLDRALGRLLASLPRTGLRVGRRDGYHVAGGVRLGLRSGVLVAGTAPPRALGRLARARLARPAGARGSVAVSVPRHGLTGWAAASRSSARAELRIDWP